MQAYGRQRDSISSHIHAPSNDSNMLQKGLRASNQLTSNQPTKTSSTTANSIVQEYKTFSKNFFSKQIQNSHALHQPQIIAGMPQPSLMAQLHNKENVEMRAQSSGTQNTGRASYQATQTQIGQQFNSTQLTNSQTTANPALNKTTSFLSAAGINMANNMGQLSQNVSAHQHHGFGGQVASSQGQSREMYSSHQSQREFQARDISNLTSSCVGQNSVNKYQPQQKERHDSISTVYQNVKESRIP